MVARGLVFLQPNDFGPWTSQRTFEEELVQFVRKYRLDTTDASILIDAQRIGVGSILTMDSDFQHARSDFHGLYMEVGCLIGFTLGQSVLLQHNGWHSERLAF